MKKQMLLSVLKWMLCAFLLYPFAALAHLIAITPTSPFPAAVNVGTTTTAIYTVTNISKIPVTVVDQSQFPLGLSIASSTCGILMPAGASCAITLQLVAPTVPIILSTELKEWAKPSADGVKLPIVVQVVQSSVPISQFTITPSAGVNGSISPSTAVTVTSGGSQTFTATPNAGFAVNQWLVDGVLVQTGGSTFTLTNITANHTVVVSFVAVGPVMSMAAGDGNLGSGNNFFIAFSNDSASTWQGTDLFNGVRRGGQLQASACTGSGTTASCASAAVTFPAVRASVPYTQDGGSTPWLDDVFGLSIAATPTGVAATGGDSNPLLVVAGQSNMLVVKPSRAAAWSQVSMIGAPSSFYQGADCSGSGASAFCAVVGANGAVLQAFTNFTQFDSVGTNGWYTPTVLGVPGVSSLSNVDCAGDLPLTRCIAVGTSNSSANNLIIYKLSNSLVWQTSVSVPITTGILTKVSCGSSLCVAIGSDGGAAPVILTSTDGGVSWSSLTSAGIQNFPPPVNNNFLTSGVSCSDTTCIVVGRNFNTTTSPLIFITTNSGATWSYVTSIGGVAPATGAFNGANCAGSGSNVICTAAGEDLTLSVPLLASKNSAGTWTYVSNVNINNVSTPLTSVTGGTFNSAAGSSSSLLKVCPWSNKM